MSNLALNYFAAYVFVVLIIVAAALAQNWWDGRRGKSGRLFPALGPLLTALLSQVRVRWPGAHKASGYLFEVMLSK